MARVRILQVLYGGLGGHASVALSLVAADRNRAWEHALLFYGIEPIRPQYRAFCVERGVSFRAEVKRPGPDLRALYRVAQHIRELRPDGVLLHSMGLAPLAVPFLALRHTSFVCVDHQANALKSRGDWFNTSVACASRLPLVVLTPDFASEIRERLGLLCDANRIDVIPNGIDLERFVPSSPSSARSGAFTISMVSRFTTGKDHQSLIDALSQLRTERPDFGVRLVLAGEGTTLKDCQRQAGVLGDHVHFPGMLGEEQLVALLQDSDLYVHSTWGETMSTAVMQAMACALPVVASDVPGVRNMIRHGETGLLAPPGDPEALLGVLKVLIDEPEQAQVLGRRARRFAEEHFNAERMFQDYDRLLRSQIAKTRGSA